MTNKARLKRINDHLESNGFSSMFKLAPKSLITNKPINFKCPIVLAGDTIKYELDYIDDLRLSSNANGDNCLNVFMKRLIEK